VVRENVTGHRCIVNPMQAVRAVPMDPNPCNTHPEFQQGMIQVPADGRMIAQAIDSLLIDPVRLGALTFHGSAFVGRLPRPIATAHAPLREFRAACAPDVNCTMAATLNSLMIRSSTLPDLKIVSAGREHLIIQPFRLRSNAPWTASHSQPKDGALPCAGLLRPALSTCKNGRFSEVFCNLAPSSVVLGHGFSQKSRVFDGFLC